MSNFISEFSQDRKSWKTDASPGIELERITQYANNYSNSCIFVFIIKIQVKKIPHTLMINYMNNKNVIRILKSIKFNILV